MKMIAEAKYWFDLIYAMAFFAGLIGFGVWTIVKRIRRGTNKKGRE